MKSLDCAWAMGETAKAEARSDFGVDGLLETKAGSGLLEVSDLRSNSGGYEADAHDEPNGS